MRLALLVAALAVPSTLISGCSTMDGAADLPAVFGADYDGNGNATVAQVRGSHLEGSIGEGPWGPSANLTVEAGAVASPPMAGPIPLGGGGETTPLGLAFNGTTLSVRIREADQLPGTTARWYVLDDASANLTAPGIEAAATLPATETFQAALSAPGPVFVGAALFASEDESIPIAVFAQAFAGRLALHWTATGEVHPQKSPDPTGMGAPWPTPREEMVDVYALALPAGATVTAITAFGGDVAPGDGTDVDLGVYAPDGTGVACSGSGGGGGTDPTDPAAASETVAAETDAAGTWSVQVGAMLDGCGGSSGYQYVNAGPVPYRLDVLVG